MSATNWPLPSTSTGLKRAAAAVDLQHPLEEFRVESRSEALCAQGEQSWWERTWQNRSPDS